MGLESQGWCLFCSGTLQKTNDAVEGHVGEFTGAVIVDDARDFVCECAKAEHIDDRLVVDVVDDVVMLSGVRNVVDGVGIVEFDIAGHAGVRDGSRDSNVGLF